MLHTKTHAEIEQIFDTNIESGLSREIAANRLEKNGRNEIIAKKGKSYPQMFWDQITEPLIYVLMAAMVICFFLGEYTDCVIIGAVILINAIIGVIQEGKAQAALEALKQMTVPNCLVKRGGEIIEIPAPELVIGDIVILEAGRQVPADLRIIMSANLMVDESALTGESLPAEKNSDIIIAKDGEAIPLGDRTNMAFMSTNVTYGRGEGIVIATGMATEIGTIAKMINEAEDGQTPLQKRLADMGKMLGLLTIGLCALLLVIGLIQRNPLGEMLITAIALAVAAVPEGLPAVVTIVLAIGVQRMVRANTIVKRLPSVETLGCVNIVCSDKTGTLTQNKMTISRQWAVDSGQEEELLTGFILCNDALISENGDRIGDPTELAFIDLGLKQGINIEELKAQYPRVGELAFDSDRKMMTTLHQDSGFGIQDSGYIAFTKGAPDEILKHCVNINQEKFEAIHNQISEMSSQALRVLALAKRTYSIVGDAVSGVPLVEDNLEFIGLMGMIDPPRPEARDAVETFRQAGVTTIMITGDHKDTALAIARELGIADDISQCITGDEIDKLVEATPTSPAKGRWHAEGVTEGLNPLAEILTKRVFARVSPEHKVIIVQAFKAAGNIVSMTGDGVNDAPSLKNADIGVAMGITGTDVAKGAADIVLTDDNFATIEKAIEEGRGIYTNIKKSIIFMMSSNFGEIVAMLVGAMMGFIPLHAIQILWINLITDSLPGLALGVDKNDAKRLMKKPPRKPSESLWAGGALTYTIRYGFIIGAITLFAYFLGGKIDTQTAMTYAFTVLATSELFHMIVMRDSETSIFKMKWNNRFMAVAFVIGFMLQIAVTEIPFLTQIFRTTQLSLKEWLILIPIAMAPIYFHEFKCLAKLIFRKKDKMQEQKLAA